MRTKLFVFFVCLLSCVIGYGKAFIVLKSGDTLQVNSLSSDSKGNLTFQKGKEEFLLPRRMWEYVEMPCPADIKKAEKILEQKNYIAAVTVFKKLAEKYKYLGWKMFCVLKQVEAMKGENGKDIEKTAEEVVDAKLYGPENELAALAGLRYILAELKYKNEDNKGAIKLLDKVIKSSDEELIAKAYNLKGDILLSEDKNKEALFTYMRPVVQFERGVIQREYSLAGIIKILKDENDKREKIYFEMLEKEYPDSKYIKELK